MPLGPNGGLKIPGWVFGLVSSVIAVVTATVFIIRDRNALENRIHQLEFRQCAMVNFLSETDHRFSLYVFREGCR